MREILFLAIFTMLSASIAVMPAAAEIAAQDTGALIGGVIVK
jgi:hypothetical protein